MLKLRAIIIATAVLAFAAVSIGGLFDAFQPAVAGRVGGTEGGGATAERPLNASGAPKPNDDFADAIVIPSLPYTNSQSITGFTIEPSEPTSCGPFTISSTAWYSFTPTTTETLFAFTPSASSATTVAVYSGATLDTLATVGCSPVGETFNATSGVTYHFQVGAFAGLGDPSPLTFELQRVPGTPTPTPTATQSPPLLNDHFEDAIDIPSLPYSDELSTDGFTIQPGEPTSCFNIGRTGWYSFTPKSTKSVTANTTGADRAVLAVYTGATLATLELVRCGSPGNEMFTVTAGETYYFQLGSFLGDPIDVTFELGPTLPTPTPTPTGTPEAELALDVKDPYDMGPKESEIDIPAGEQFTVSVELNQLPPEGFTYVRAWVYSPSGPLPAGVRFTGGTRADVCSGGGVDWGKAFFNGQCFPSPAPATQTGTVFEMVLECSQTESIGNEVYIGSEQDGTVVDDDNGDPYILVTQPRGNDEVADLIIVNCIGNAPTPTPTQTPTPTPNNNNTTTVDTAGTVGLYSSLSLDENGNPVVSYYDASNSDLKILHCNDPNCAGADESITSPDADGAVGQYTSLALDASDNPVISYYDATNAELKVMHCNDPNCAGGDESIEAPDPSKLEGQHTSLVLDVTGNPVVSYRGLSPAGLKVLHCGNPNCTVGNSIVTLDDADFAGTEASLALDSSGNPVVSYYGLPSSYHPFVGLMVVHCGDPDCTTGNTYGPIKGDVIAGGDPSLVLDEAGNPVISYYQPFGANLQLARCGNPDCTAGNSIADVDAAGVVGQHSSLVLDELGNPVISYQAESGNWDLKLAHCGNATCTAGNSTVAVDLPGDVGKYTSLQLDASGNPVISYYDESNDDLKLVHCKTPNCGPGPGVDTDGDGCTDEQENGLDERLGGKRDYLNFWDFFDTPESNDPLERSRSITAGDIFRLVLRFQASGTPGDPMTGPVPDAPAYHPAFDRSPPSPGDDAWDLHEADGVIATNDILFMVNQFGHTCAADS